jgi:hypothetical protein
MIEHTEQTRALIAQAKADSMMHLYPSNGLAPAPEGWKYMKEEPRPAYLNEREYEQLLLRGA